MGGANSVPNGQVKKSANIRCSRRALPLAQDFKLVIRQVGSVGLNRRPVSPLLIFALANRRMTVRGDGRS